MADSYYRKTKDDISKVYLNFVLGPERDTKKKGGDKSFYHEFCAKEELGTKILNSLLSKRDYRMEKSADNKDVIKYDYLMFFSDDREKKLGFMSNMYGAMGLFSLHNRMNVPLTNEQVAYLQTITESILSYLDNYGYCLYPYVDRATNKRLFSKTNPYVGSMTWALSFLTNVYNAVCKDKWLKLSEANMALVKDQIVRIIRFFNDSVLLNESQEPIGWGFVQGCVKSSLFFTYSVLEAYSDFEDSILFPIKEKKGNYKACVDLLAYINEKSKVMYDENGSVMLDENGDAVKELITEKWKDNCYRIAAKVWMVYKDKIRDYFVDDNFLKNVKDINIIDEDSIKKSNSSNALFNTLYIVFILIYGYANNSKENQYMLGVNDEDVVMVIGSALRNVQRTYEQFKALGIDYLIDTFRVPFKIMHESDELKYEYIRTLNSEMLIDTSILPMLVKANNMLAYYVVQYPVKEMSQLFLELFKALPKGQEEWVWDANRYDVKITERYIEAIADFYDYYEKYELRSIDTQNSNARSAALKEKELEKKYQEQKEKEIEAERARLIEEGKEIARSEYQLENAIRASVKDWTMDLLVEQFRNSFEYDTDDKGIESDKEALEGKDRLLNDYIHLAVFACLKKAIRESKLLEQKDDEAIQKLLATIEQLSDDTMAALCKRMAQRDKNNKK